MYARPSSSTSTPASLKTPSSPASSGAQSYYPTSLNGPVGASDTPTAPFAPTM